MFAGSQRHEAVVRPAPGDATGRELTVRSLRGRRRQNQCLIEVLINQRYGILRRNACVTRQPGEYRVRLREGMTAQAQRSPACPRGNRTMTFV